MPSVIKAAKLGDAAIIKSNIKILANENIKVISSNFLILNFIKIWKLFKNKTKSTEILIQLKKELIF